MPVFQYDPSLDQTVRSGLVIDADGKIWFSGEDSDTLIKAVKYDPVGDTFTKYLNAFSHGTTPYERVDLAPNGDLFFIGRVHGSIVRFRPEDSSWAKWDTPYTPVGALWDGIVDNIGIVYFTQSATGVAEYFASLDPDTGTFNSIQDGPNEVRDIVYSKSANIIFFIEKIGTNYAVRRYQPGTGFLANLPVTGQTGIPRLSVPLGDLIYYCFGTTTQQLKISTNTLIASATSTTSPGWSPMAISPVDGNVWKQQGAATGTIKRFDPIFETENAFNVDPGKSVESYGIAVDVSGNVWCIGESDGTPALYQVGTSLFVPPLTPTQYAGKFDRGFG